MFKIGNENYRFQVCWKVPTPPLRAAIRFALGSHYLVIIKVKNSCPPPRESPENFRRRVLSCAFRPLLSRRLRPIRFGGVLWPAQAQRANFY